MGVIKGTILIIPNRIFTPEIFRPKCYPYYRLDGLVGSVLNLQAQFHIVQIVNMHI